MNSQFDTKSWDSQEAHLDQIEADLTQYAKIAKTLHDRATIEATSTRLADFKATRTEWRNARGRLDAAVSAWKAADAEAMAAKSIEQTGSLVAAQAIKNHEALIVAEAKTRALHPSCSQHFATCAGTRERLSTVANMSTDRTVIEETRSFAAKLFEYDNPQSAFDAAERAGKSANADRAAWWLLAETIVRDEFKKSHAAALQEAKRRDGEVGNFANPYNSRRERTYVPTMEMLEQSFARRRAAFEAERRRVEAQLAQLNGQFQTLGGAA